MPPGSDQHLPLPPGPGEDRVLGSLLRLARSMGMTDEQLAGFRRVAAKRALGVAHAEYVHLLREALGVRPLTMTHANAVYGSSAVTLAIQTEVVLYDPATDTISQAVSS